MASPRILCQVCRVSWTSKPVWTMQPRKVSNNLHSASSPSAPPPWHSSSHIPPTESPLHPPRSDSWWTPRWYSCPPSRWYSWSPQVSSSPLTSVRSRWQQLDTFPAQEFWAWVTRRHSVSFLPVYTYSVSSVSRQWVDVWGWLVWNFRDIRAVMWWLQGNIRQAQHKQKI